MEHKNTITLDDLARIVQNGFLKIDEQLGAVNERLNNMDERLDSMDIRLHHLEDTTEDIKANLNKKVDKIEYNTLEYRVERLEEAPAV